MYDQARNELFSHILRCGVLEASESDRKEWFDDTMGYLGDRYDRLSNEQLASLRLVGERYCRPVIPHSDADKPAEETVGA